MSNDRRARRRRTTGDTGHTAWDRGGRALKVVTRSADPVTVTALSTDDPALTTSRSAPGSGTPVTGSPAREAAELDRLLRQDALRMVFQPVVDLCTRTPVAFEALVRGPVGSPLASPADLFRVAAATSRLAELDGACRRTALAEASAQGLSAPWTLFVNSELPTDGILTAGPEAAGVGRPPAPAGTRYAVVVELPERALTARPIEFLHLVDRLRARGWGIALDDVGADPASLALLPLVRPDVIKLDLRLVQDQPDSEIAAIVAAVGAQAERDGTAVLAEGIETAEQARAAVAMGATLGQGWLFGRPGSLAENLRVPPPRESVTIVPRPRPAGAGTPFELAAARRRARPADRDLVREMARHLELQALRSGEPCVVVATRPDGGADRDRDERFRQIACGAAFVATFHAADDTVVVAPAGVRRVDLPADDPVLGESLVAVLGPHFSGAVVARGSGAEDTDDVEVVVTHARHLVVDVVAGLLDRVVPTTPTTAPAALAEAAPTPTGPDTSGLEVLLADALEADRRVGTATGLLLLGVHGSRAADLDAGEPGSPGAVVRRMRSSVRSQDRWVPLTDDLHALLLTGLPRTGAEGVVDRVADALLHALESSPLTDPDAGARVSIGASLSPTRAVTATDAVAQARAALEAARAAGGHCARIWPV